jgi:hypothetical protein
MLGDIGSGPCRPPTSRGYGILLRLGCMVCCWRFLGRKLAGVNSGRLPDFYGLITVRTDMIDTDSPSEPPTK